MEVKVAFNKRTEVLSIDDEETVEGLLKVMDLFPDSHIVIRGKSPIPLTERIREGDELRIVKVASGG
ncbi:MAG: hypothetical protein MIO87_06010 [Methanomassiliicoccales archaeon]|nr:hypothetical protein [Methanomassiliicoccales archaeon]TFG56441.1 MAG: thiamine biosynthesis protein ThiS [Methanomassiliicoccus sp.]